MRRIFLFIFIILASSIAQAAIYHMPSPANDIIGQTIIIHVQKGDTIDKLTREYEVSYHELLEANPNIKPRRLRIDSSLLIPSEFILPKYRQGIVINVAELRLYYFTPDGQYVFTTPVGLGRSGWRTPTMVSKVIKKEEYPTWHVPKSILASAARKGKILADKIPPGPDNPLGEYAIYLARNGYLIHGTNDPRSVGKYYSSGCIRLYSHAIETLFQLVPIGTPVHILHHPNKAGWLNGELYLESHRPVSNSEPASELNTQDPEAVIQEAAAKRPLDIAWHKVNLVVKQKLGVPESVGTELYNNGISMN